MNSKVYLKSLALFFIFMFLNINSAFAETSSISDAAITGSVKTKIAADSSLSGTAISVSTSNGVVNLSGKVDSNTQAEAATELAQSTTGVKDVDTRKLTVAGSEEPMTDTFITAKIKGMFLQQKLFSNKDISAMSVSVETNNGVVSLSGTADNQTQIDNAIKIAKSIAGVKEVKSTVKISTSNT